MTHADLRKKREILFSKFPPGQVPEAVAEAVRALPGVRSVRVIA